MNVLIPLLPYEPKLEQFDGLLQAACTGPLVMAFLQAPNTASSGLRGTSLTWGFLYGFLDLGALSSMLCDMVLLP